MITQIVCIIFCTVENNCCTWMVHYKLVYNNNILDIKEKSCYLSQIKVAVEQFPI